MERILIIGGNGAGKTTFAKALAEKTQLPLVHLDALYWRRKNLTGSCFRSFRSPGGSWMGISAGPFRSGSNTVTRSFILIFPGWPVSGVWSNAP